MFVQDGTSQLKKVLTNPPIFLTKAAPINEISKLHQFEELNVAKLKAEYQQLLSIYDKHGIVDEQMMPKTKMTNDVFARDFGACVNEGYILGKFKEPIRFAEHQAYEQKMAELGIPKITEVEGDGLFEGGDFAFLNETTIAIGMLDRTNRSGFNQIQAKLEQFGYSVHPVHADSRYLHLDMCFNLVAPHLAIAYRDGLPDSFLKLLDQLNIEIISVPESAIFEHGCNLESLGNNKVISLAQNKDVNHELRKSGMEVIELNITEILKAGGGPHCMAFPLKRG